MPKVTVIPATLNKFTGYSEAEVKKRRVAAYARVSTDSDEQATSYEAQMDYYTNYIQRRPEWDFVKVYADEGISGLGTKNRPGFNEMMNDALNGKIDLILTKSISRFARNTVDTLTAVRRLKDKNVEIWFEKENIQTFDSKGELFITIMSSLAQEESRSISENVTWGKRKAFADGKIYIPYKRFLGYRRGADDLPEIVPEEAETVKRIYDMFLYGMTPGAIAKQLTVEEIKTPGGKDRWQSSTVQSILTNEKYRGDAILQKTFTVDFLTKKSKKNEGEVQQYHVENSHPAIINPVVFDRVQAEIERRKQIGRKYSGSSVFSSRLICGECGEYYGPKVWNSTDKYRHTVWQCNGKFSGDAKCSTPHLTEEEIQDRFMKAYSSLIEKKETLIEDLKLMQETLCDCSEINARINKLRAEKNVVENLMLECVKNSDDDYEKEFSEYNDRFEKLTSQIREAGEVKEKRNARAAAIGGFMFELSENGCDLTEFDPRLWIDVIDTAKVMPSGEIVFRFVSGAEVTA